jgi:hypothetical protein
MNAGKDDVDEWDRSEGGKQARTWSGPPLMREPGQAGSRTAQLLVDVAEDGAPYFPAVLGRETVVGESQVAPNDDGNELEGEALPDIAGLTLLKDHRRVERNFPVYCQVLSERDEVKVVRVRQITLLNDARA